VSTRRVLVSLELNPSTIRGASEYRPMPIAGRDVVSFTVTDATSSDYDELARGRVDLDSLAAVIGPLVEQALR
jgi:hypothetical protein